MPMECNDSFHYITTSFHSIPSKQTYFSLRYNGMESTKEWKKHQKRIYSLLQDADPLRTRDKIPCVSSSLSQGNQKPNTSFFQYAPHHISCHQRPIIQYII